MQWLNRLKIHSAKYWNFTTNLLVRWCQTWSPTLHDNVRTSCFCPTMRFASDKLAVAKQELCQMKKMAIGTKAWWKLAPMWWLPSPQWLNNTRSIPNSTYMQDFTSHLDGKTIFSKVDLIRGYHQIPNHPDKIQKTAVITPFGRCKFFLHAI